MTTGSTKRRGQLPRDKRGPAGERLCRWCEKPVPKGRRQWCSQACVDEYMERNDPEYQRRKVWERDRGVCASCGIDCDRLERIWARVRRMVWNGWASKRARMEELLPAHRRPSWWEARGLQMPSIYTLHREAQEAAIQRPFRWLGKEGAPPPHRRTLWDMDHIVPVVEGGGETGLENLRTLCWWCHKGETAKLARRRARARRPQLTIPGTEDDE